MGGANEPFNVVQKKRTLNSYPVLDTEVDGIGKLSLIEQIALNVAFTMLGAFIGAVTAIASGAVNTVMWVVLWTSAIVFIMALTFFIIARRQSDKMKDSFKS